MATMGMQNCADIPLYTSCLSCFILSCSHYNTAGRDQ